MLVGKHLDLDVARVRQVAFEQDAVVTEGRRGFLTCGIQRDGKFVRLPHDAHAATTAAGDRLDHQRKADAVRLISKERGILSLAMIAGQQRHAGRLHQRLGRGLGSHRAHRRRWWPDEHDARRRAGFGKRWVLR